MGKATTTNEDKAVATKGTDHVARSTSPDVCLLPSDEAKPFPNHVESKKLAAGQTETTFIAGEPIWTRIGELGPPSEPAHEGTKGGQISGTYRAEAKATSYSPNLFFEGEPAVRTDDTTTQNHGNTEGCVELAAEASELGGAPAGAGDKGSVGHPVDPVTGEVSTVPSIDLNLPGPMRLVVYRLYRSSRTHRDVGLGRGWTHSLAWELDTDGSSMRALSPDGARVDFNRVPGDGETVASRWGWRLSRTGSTFALTSGDLLRREFAPASPDRPIFQLVAVIDRAGRRIVIRREGSAIVAIGDSAGRTVHVDRDASGHIASLWLAVGDRTHVFARYGYDGAGRLISATDPLGFAHRYAYDERDLLVCETDRSGVRYHFRYDARHRCVETWCEEAAGASSCLADGLPELLADGATPVRGLYHTVIRFFEGLDSEVVDALGVTRYQGNDDGLLQASDTHAIPLRRSYDAAGKLVSRSDARGATATFERDRAGRIVGLIDPVGRRTRAELDETGMPLTIVDPAQGVTRFERDAIGRIVAFHDAAGGVLRYRYDARGQLTELVDRAGSATQLRYDGSGNPVEASLPDGTRWQWRYDALGRCTEQVDAAGGRWRYHHSDRGQLARIDFPDGGVMRFAYDGEGRMREIVSATGGVTRLEWGAYNLLKRVADPNGRTVELRYNHAGDIVEVVNGAGETHRIWYDAGRRVRAQETYDGRAIEYSYDGGGLPLRLKTASGQSATLTYDRAGYLVEWRTPSSEQCFAYDRLGALVGATQRDVAVELERDAVGRVVREVQTVDGEAHWVEVAYGADGHRGWLRTSLGHCEKYAHDKRSVMRDLGDSAIVEQHRDALGREVVRVLPGGGRIESRYQSFGRVEQRRVVARATPRSGEPDWVRQVGVTADTAYEYDAAGQLVQCVDRDDGATRFERDAAGFLIGVEQCGAARFYHDVAGNRSCAGEPTALGPGGVLLRRGAWEYRWDADARLVEKRCRDGSGSEPTWRYRWNDLDQLARVELPDGGEVAFGYDPFGRRVSKRLTRRDGAGERSTTTTRFVWHRDVVIHEIERGPEGERVRTYAYDEASLTPLAHRDGSRGDGGRWLHYVEGPAGAPTRLCDGGGRIVARVERDVWGAALEGQPEAPTPMGAPGQYHDAETGLAYNRLRYYDPDAGRYISPDPAGLLGGSNSFAYVRDPTGRVDPLGLQDSYYPCAGEMGLCMPPPPPPTHITGPGDHFLHGTVKSRGWFTVHTHGNPNGMEVPSEFDTYGNKDTWTETGSDVAAWIRSAPGYQDGMPVVLQACETGKLSRGIAQQLANEMGVPVRAPTGLITVDVFGLSAISDRGTSRWRLVGMKLGLVEDDGVWRTFYPDD